MRVAPAFAVLWFLAVPAAIDAKPSREAGLREQRRLPEEEYAAIVRILESQHLFPSAGTGRKVSREEAIEHLIAPAPGRK